jgi:DNA-binding MarR family transcriptional regulator
MAEQLLDRVLREIRERRRAAEAAYDESGRLEQALAALGPPRRTRAAADDISDQRRSGPRRPRAATGANRSAVLALIRDRPGVSAGEVAEATGIARSTVTTTLGRLVDAGEVERSELPGGRTGFSARDAQRPDAARAAPAIPGGSGDEAAPTPSRRPPRRGAKGTSAKRAPRGENLRRIREAIEQRPGATAGELASATGIARPTVASALGKLARDGELEKTKLPDAGVGYRNAREADRPAESAAAGEGGSKAAESGSAG